MSARSAIISVLRPLKRAMATSHPEPAVLEGIIAVHKPVGLTSADCIRKIKPKIINSPIFEPYIQRESAKRDLEPQHERQKRKNKRVEVKIGHGGTLDPMASGVLVIGLGQGTKSLQGFLECTKEYVTEAIFGCSTDTYDRTGKRMHMAPYEHITREKVEEALAKFRGDIMQVPPIYSALRINGKRYYEYAREGKELPVEMQARPVKCLELELLEFTTEHDFKYPKAEVDSEKRQIEELATKAEAGDEEATNQLAEVLKAKTEREEQAAKDEMPKGKRRKLNKQEFMRKKAEGIVEKPEVNEMAEVEVLEEFPGPKPPIVKLRMVVGSGFYVRSLVHDLGKALGSAANMCSLARTRQGDYALGKNVIEWNEFMDEDGKWEEQTKEELTGWVERNHEKLNPPKHVDGRPQNRKPQSAKPETQPEPEQTAPQKRPGSPLEKE